METVIGKKKEHRRVVNYWDDVAKSMRIKDSIRLYEHNDALALVNAMRRIGHKARHNTVEHRVTRIK